MSYDVDYARGFAAYEERFQDRFGERPAGAFVKFGKHMVHRLSAAEFPARVDAYVAMHTAVTQMVSSGSTISDALVLEFVEAAAWVAVQAPDLRSIFCGDLGDPSVAAPRR